MPFKRYRHRTLKQFAGTVLLTSIMVTCGIAVSRQIGLFESSELDAYDHFIQLKGPAPTDERILVVGIDEADIQNRKEFPIEDGTLADALEVLESYNPRVIGVDIGRDVPQGPPEGRGRLIDILSGSDRMVTACVLSSFDEPGVPAAPGTDPDLIGFADFPVDADGAIRRSILISAPAEFSVEVGETHLCNDPDPENEVLSLSLLLSLIYLETDNIFPEQTLWGDLKLGNTVFSPLFEKSGGYASTGATDYQVMLNYRAPQDAVRQVSLTDILERNVAPEWIEDRAVLIGYTSSITKDIFTTPYSETALSARGMPGVVVHAQATSQILSAVLDGRALIQSWPELAEGLWIWSWALLGGTIAFYSRRISLFVVLSIGLIGGCWGICLGLFFTGIWLPLVPSLSAIILTGVGSNLLYQANQSGYSQAIYEQIKEQLRGRADVNQNQRGQKIDAIEMLVRRAREIRQHRDSKAMWNDEVLAQVSDDPIHVTFDSPEMQSIYEEIKTQAYRDLEMERAELEADKKRQKISYQEKRVQALIQKSQNARQNGLTGEPTEKIFMEVYHE